MIRFLGGLAMTGVFFGLTYAFVGFVNGKTIDTKWAPSIK